MSNYRRWYQPGGTYFFTVVTLGCRPLFASTPACQLLGTIVREVRTAMPFRTIAAALLPDHLHAIWALPSGDDDFPNRWRAIKAQFTARYLIAGGVEIPATPPRTKTRRRGVWQRRFWERLVRDETELAALCDYIHYNPVKHGVAQRPSDWPWSTFHRFVAAGEYEENWGGTLPQHISDIDYE